LDSNEVGVLIGSALIASSAGLQWYRRLIHAGPPWGIASPRIRLTLGVVPIVSLIGLARALATSAAHEVRGDFAYFLLFMLVGAVWLVLTVRATQWLGLDALALRSAPDRVDVERPRWFRAIWHNALVTLGLRRNTIGGFGGELPVPGSSG